MADLNHIMESADYPIAAEPIVATIKKFRLTPKDAIAHLKRLGSESRALFKAYDQPVKLGSARVTKQTQEALEGLIERRLKGSLYEDFVAARVRIAKTHCPAQDFRPLLKLGISGSLLNLAMSRTNPR